MYRLLIILPIFLFFGRISLSQPLVSVRQKISQSGNLNSGNILSCIDGETIYFTPTNLQNTHRVIFSISLEGVLKDQFTLKPKGKKENKQERIVQFSVIGDKLVLLSNLSIHFYERSGKQFIHTKAIKNSFSFSGMERLGNKLLLHVCYPFHPLDQEKTNLWATVDLVSQEITNFHVPKIDNSKFGCFVNSWVSVYKSTIAHASTSDYKIVFYDENFVPVDSILDKTVQFGIDSSYVNNINLQSKDAISNFMSYDEENFTRIRKVFYLDENRILVLLKLANSATYNKGKAELDIWVKDSTGWIKKNAIYGDDIYVKGAVYNDQQIFLGDIFQNVYSLCIKDKKIYCVSFPFYPKIVTQNFDMIEDIDSYFKDKGEFFYGLEIFNVGFN